DAHEQRLTLLNNTEAQLAEVYAQLSAAGAEIERLQALLAGGPADGNPADGNPADGNPADGKLATPTSLTLVVNADDPLRSYGVFWSRVEGADWYRVQHRLAGNRAKVWERELPQSAP